MITDYMITEDQYKTRMEEEARPFLAAHTTEMMLSREEGKEIYCLACLPDDKETMKGVIVISHGFCESTLKYRELVYYFLKEGYGVYIFDQCGHGKSYRLTEDPSLVHIDSYERYVDDLIYIAHTAKKQLKGPTIYLFGHSMGGGIAAAAAAKASGLFAKVILSSPMIRPKTGTFPWFGVKLLCSMAGFAGKNMKYAPGQVPYSKPDSFEESGAISRERFEYYQEIRRKDPIYQQNAASYGWMNEAVRLNSYLQEEAWQQIQCPVLLFQAQKDSFVKNDQQELFVQKIRDKAEARLVGIPGTKHEIYNSHDASLSIYLEEIFKFFNSDGMNDNKVFEKSGQSVEEWRVWAASDLEKKRSLEEAREKERQKRQEAEDALREAEKATDEEVNADADTPKKEKKKKGIGELKVKE